tara:strand:+ start:529 stop:1479 length:951 start_codon:yes stop_codon:yes gene_type:complete
MPLGIGKKKKAKDFKNLPDKFKEIIESNAEQSDGTSGSGLNCSNLPEPIPYLNQADSEVVYKNDNNASIVLGRDRPAARTSGYGGQGASGAGSVDIVVGRMSGASEGPKSNIYVDPNFEADAARIYISQRTDIDKNFGLVGGSVGLSTARSGIGMKADAVRIMGREGIKLVTGTDKKNSLGEKIQTTRGIDLIAGNDDESGSAGLEPIPKGEKLVSALKEMSERIDEINGILSSFLMAQMKLNIQLAGHVHISPFFGIPTTPAPNLLIAAPQATIQELTNCYVPLYGNKIKLMLDEVNNLEPFGSGWICSRFNNVN